MSLWRLETAIATDDCDSECNKRDLKINLWRLEITRANDNCDSGLVVEFVVAIVKASVRFVLSHH